MTDELKKIQELTNSLELTPIEEKRLTQELIKVYNRLKTRDYQKSGYSQNTFDIPNRVQEIYGELEFYCELGKKWHTILEAIEIHQYTKVVDLCSGYAPKVELGLFYAQYAGEVLLIDKDSSATDQLTRFMELFQPRFSLYSLHADLSSLQERYDCVTANHILDDLIIDSFARKLAIPTQDIYEKEETIVTIWHHIVSRYDQHLQEMVDCVAPVLSRLVSPGGILCLTQYQSYFERVMNMKRAEQFNTEFFHTLSARLTENEFRVQEDALARMKATDKPRFEEDEVLILRKQ